MERDANGLVLMKSQLPDTETSSTVSVLSDSSSDSRFSLRPCEEHWTLDDVIAEHHEMHNVGICTPCALHASGKECLMGWKGDYCHLSHGQLARASQRRKQERFRCKKALDELGETVADEHLFQERLREILQRRDAFTVSCVKSKLRSWLRAQRIPESTLALAVCALKRSEKEVLREDRALISL
eukprot:TRINITY_DN19793_c0_g1_i1.p1 TRINITY_DN19793_c0_g1~~TRINITY_DN19793_c0_g1_i1.p1  ORF type:complete len:184 (-),score=36.98 TRINITY_DN19793_c0_g1_i1:169-720(-)